MLIAGIVMKFLLVGKSKMGISFESVNLLLFSGLSIIVPVFAITITRCNSIMWIAILLWLWLKFTCRNNFQNCNRNTSIACIIIHSLVAIVAFSFTYWLFFIHTAGNVFCDQYFYANVSNHLLSSHIESSDVFSESTKAIPYHYCDLWITTFALKLFGGNAVYMLICVTYSILLYLTISSTLCIADKLLAGMNKMVITLVSIAFIGFAPLTSLFIDWGGAIGVSKHLVLSFFFLTTCYFIIVNKKHEAAFSALMAIPMYSTAAPGILVFIFLYGIVTSNKKSFKKLFNSISMICIVVFIAYCVFYILQPGNSGILNSTQIYAGNILINTLLFTIKRTLRCTIQITPVVCTLFAIKIFYKKEKLAVQLYEHIVIILLIAALISNIVAGFLRNFMIDGGQIATNFSSAAVWIFIYVSIMLLLKNLDFINSKYISIICVVISLIYLITYTTNLSYCFERRVPSEQEIALYSTMKSELKGKENVSFGYFRNYDVEENHNTQKTRAFMFYPLERIGLIKDDGVYYAHCLSSLSLPNDIDPVWDDHKNTEVYKYYTKHNNITKEQALVGFILDQQLQYIIVEKYATLPESLFPFVSEIASWDGNIVYKVSHAN